MFILVLGSQCESLRIHQLWCLRSLLGWPLSVHGGKQLLGRVLRRGAPLYVLPTWTRSPASGLSGDHGREHNAPYCLLRRAHCSLQVAAVEPTFCPNRVRVLSTPLSRRGSGLLASAMMVDDFRACNPCCNSDLPLASVPNAQRIDTVEHHIDHGPHIGGVFLYVRAPPPLWAALLNRILLQARHSAAFLQVLRHTLPITKFSWTLACCVYAPA